MLSLIVGCLCVNVADGRRVSATFVLVPGPAGGDTAPPHLCVPLQGAKSFCNPSQGRCSCILAARRTAPRKTALSPRVSSGPPGIFQCVDLSSGVGHYLRREMKGLLEYWMSLYCVCYSRGKCLLLVISLAPFSRQYQFNTSDSGLCAAQEALLHTSNY